MSSPSPSAIVVAALLLAPSAAAAADCACDHDIDDSVYTIDGVDMGFGPGDRICFQAGSYGGKRFERMQGAEGNPIVITNCGGLVDLTRLSIVDDSRHVRLTGSGDPAVRYGLRFDAADFPAAVGIGGYSTNIEVDHIEVTASGFAGIMGKTDDAPITFEQHDTLIHDNYIHDVDGEGIYLGYSFYNETQAHRLIGTRVYNNIIVDTGWDGIQVGSADEDTKIYDNYIENVGTDANFVHGNGIQLGGGTTGEVYGNVIVKTYAHAVINFTPGESLIYNNLFIENGADGIWHSPRIYTRAGLDPWAANINNTIVLPGDDAIELHSGSQTPDNYILNNLMVSQNDFLNLANNVPRVVGGNMEFTDLATVGFVAPLLYADLATIDVHDRRQTLIDGYALAAGSTAIDAGDDVRTYGVPEQPGKAPGVYDVGAFLASEDAPEPGGTDAGGDAGGSGMDAGYDAGGGNGGDAGGFTPDAGPSTGLDAGGLVDAGIIGTPGADAGSFEGDDNGGDSVNGTGGCGCAAGGGGNGAGSGSLLVLLFALVASRLRRRARS